ncbi:phosphatidylinositol kinase- protein kinase tor1, partial [Coemansia spiralis]
DLFLLMNDEVFEVRLTVLAVIGRLANMNPAHVMPSLRRMVVQLLTELEYARSNREREECIQLLMVLVRAAENWVRPYVGDIFTTILPRIDDAPAQLASKLLDTVAALARVGGSDLVPYYDELLASIVRALSDGSSAPKRLAALKALSSCASFCAMVIDPYTEYPQLFDILSPILKDNSDPQMRAEALRTVGALGAIDSHRFKDALAGSADGASGPVGGTSGAGVGAGGAVAAGGAGSLAGGAQRRAAGLASRKTEARRRRNRRRQGRAKPNVMTAFNSEKPAEALVGDIPVESYGTAFSTDEYYTTVAVSALLNILNDPGEAASHMEAAQALTRMFAPQKSKAAPYIERLLQALLAAMELAPDADNNSVVFYIKRLHQLVETAQQLIRPHLAALCQLFAADALGSIQQQNESIELLKALAEALVGDFGPHVSTVLPYLLAVMDRDDSDARWPTRNALAALQVLSPSLEGYLFLVMPRLITLLDPAQHPRAIVAASLVCISALVMAVNCSSFASRIVLTLVRLLQSVPTPELQTAVIDVLCTLMEQLQDEFTLFMPTIEAAMRKRGALGHARYERNARLLFSGRLIPKEPPRAAPQSLSEAVVAATPAQGADAEKQDMNVVQLRRAWSAKQQTSKDGWMRWLRDLTCELLEQSPSNSLRACSSLAGRHARLGRNLFNAAFVSCWAQLTGGQQQEIIASLQGVAANREVPAEILQAILGLAEYMERDEKQIPIDLKLLGDYADRCHALAKELHYKEAEWTLEKNYETITKLIELNQNLDLQDSAVGMLDYVRREQADIQENVEWYMRLHQWDKALVVYRRQEAERGDSLDNTIGQVRCLFEMSDWAALGPVYERIWNGDDHQLQLASANIGMNMAWTTGDIDRMEFYLTALPSNNGDKSFCRALLAVHRGNFAEAQQYIDDARQAIDLDLTPQITESDSRGYSQLFLCQMLTELEEVIEYKTAHDDRERQTGIVTSWRERLSGIQQDVGMWQRLLRLRSMVLRPILDLDTWIKYVNMSRKSGQLRIARDAIAQLLDDEAVYLEQVHRGEVENTLPKVTHQAQEYVRLSAQMARQRQMSPGEAVADAGAAAQSWEGRTRRFSSTGAVGANAPLDKAIRLSQQPALVYMYLKYKWAANERREAFQMLQMFARDYAAKIGFDVHHPNAFADNADARLLPGPNGYVDAAADTDIVHLLARFYFKQAEWLSSVQQSASLAREAQSRAGAGDALNGDASGRRRGRSSTLGGSGPSAAAAARGAARASEDGRAWQEAQILYELNSSNIGESILESYRAATVLDRKWYKAWHSLALRHYLETQRYENEHATVTEDIVGRHVVPAVHGFFRAIQLSTSETTLQDTLRLLTAWFNYSRYEKVAQAVQDGFNAVPIRTWLQVIPQILARIHIRSESTRRLIGQLLVEVGKAHPQAILFSLYVTARSDNAERSHGAKEVLAQLHEPHAELVEETEVVSRELIRITLLFPEMWQEALRAASSHYYVQRDVMEMMHVLRQMHKRTHNPETLREYHFVQMFGGELAAAEALLVQYFAADAAHRNEALVQQAWDTYYVLFRRIDKLFPGPTTLTLKDTAPALLKCRDMRLAMPGSYNPDEPLVTISSIDPHIYVYGTKQRPRRMYLYGSDGKKHTFLLKGREDLRQDERVMQLFGLINSLLARDNETSRRSLAIERFPVIPLSSNSGLIGFYPNCDNINNLLRYYREAHGQPVNLEQRMALQFSPNWETLTVMQKVESFEYALSNTPGNDLQRVMWYKAPNAEEWLTRRTNYTRSLAVMSIAGYILGLGDRHPANILIHERTGKVVHIDLGDCFEIAAHREKFPEKVPFRLTRMLIMPMEVGSIEGTFKYTANHTMRVLRANRDSLMAVLEAFVFDPLVSWGYIRESDAGPPAAAAPAPAAIPAAPVPAGEPAGRQPPPRLPRDGRAAEHAARWSMGNDTVDLAAVGASKPEAWMSKAGNNSFDAMDGRGWQTGNPKARAIVKRIHDKLVGTDFNRNDQLTEAQQIDKLITQATSSENLAVLYVGWVPLW